MMIEYGLWQQISTTIQGIQNRNELLTNKSWDSKNHYFI